MALTQNRAPAPTSHAHNLRAVFEVRGFRRLLATRVASQLADGFFQAGLGSTLLFNPEREASGLKIATAFALLLLPYSVIGPYVGVFLDRWSRRTIINLANLVRAILVMPAVLIIYFDSSRLLFSLAGPIFLAIAFGIIGLNRFVLAGVAAAIPHVVEDKHLVTGNAASTTLGSVAYTLGLGGSALLLGIGIPKDAHGYALVSSLAVLGYVAAAFLVRRSFTIDALGPDATERSTTTWFAGLVEVGRGMVTGLRHLGEQRGAAYAIAAQSAFRLLYGVLAMATLLLYAHYFNTGGPDVSGEIGGVGRLVIAGGAGILVAALLTPPVARRVGGWRWVSWLLTAVGAVVLLFGLPFVSPLLLVAVFFVNVAAQSTKIVVDTAVQHECADEYRGRVFSLNDTAYNMSFVVGLFIGALTLPENGRSPVGIVFVAVGCLAVAAWYATAGGRWARRVGDDIAGPMSV